MAGRVVTVKIVEKDAGIKIESYLKRVLGFSPKQISRLKFRRDGIRVNGQRQRVTYVLQAGDCLQLLMQAGSMEGLLPKKVSKDSMTAKKTGEDKAVTQAPSLQILYEDQDLLLVCKPPGLVCHPSHGHHGDTLANQVADYAACRGENWSIRMVGRLDKDTSGIVVFGKNAETAALLARQRERGELKKAYLALAEGHFSCAKGLIDLPIAREKGSLMRMQIAPEGKSAFTSYQVLHEEEDSSLLLVQLLQGRGRTHQIRVHLASLGHPLVGDPLYGNLSLPWKRESLGNHQKPERCWASECLALHAWRVEFRHPFSGRQIEVKAPLPKWCGRQGMKFEKGNGKERG